MPSRPSSSCPFVFHRSGLRRGLHLLCLLLTSPRYSASVSRRPASILRSTREISRGKTRYLRIVELQKQGDAENERAFPHLTHLKLNSLWNGFYLLISFLGFVLSSYIVTLAFISNP
jgi:hypothetical protein